MLILPQNFLSFLWFMGAHICISDALSFGIKSHIIQHTNSSMILFIITKYWRGFICPKTKPLEHDSYMILCRIYIFHVIPYQSTNQISISRCLHINPWTITVLTKRSPHNNVSSRTEVLWPALLSREPAGNYSHKMLTNFHPSIFSSVSTGPLCSSTPMGLVDGPGLRRG